MWNPPLFKSVNGENNLPIDCDHVSGMFARPGDRSARWISRSGPRLRYALATPAVVSRRDASPLVMSSRGIRVVLLVDATAASLRCLPARRACGHSIIGQSSGLQRAKG